MFYFTVMNQIINDLFKKKVVLIMSKVQMPVSVEMSYLYFVWIINLYIVWMQWSVFTWAPLQTLKSR